MLRRLGLGSQWRKTSQAESHPQFVAVGFPKTGNTWTRILLGRYVQQLYGLQELPLFDARQMTELRHQGYAGINGRFTHEPLVWDAQTADCLNYDNVVAPFAKERVLLLVRHPLDVMVSHFMHMKYRLALRHPYPGSVTDFIYDPVWGLSKFFRFHQLWAEHCQKVDQLLLWRYEDLLREPHEQTRTMLRFLDIPIDEMVLADAIEYASFDNLKKIEASGSDMVYKSSGGVVLARGDSGDPNAFHVRKGQAGGYKDELPSDLVAELELQVAQNMPELFGYR